MRKMVFVILSCLLASSSLYAESGDASKSEAYAAIKSSTMIAGIIEVIVKETGNPCKISEQDLMEYKLKGQGFGDFKVNYSCNESGNVNGLSFTGYVFKEKSGSVSAFINRMDFTASE